MAQRVIIRAIFSIILVQLTVSANAVVESDHESLQKLEESFLRFNQITAMGQMATNTWKYVPQTNSSQPIIDISEVVKLLNESVSLIFEVLYENSTSQCARDLVYVLLNLKEEWALRMLDASGKLASGLLEGNIRWPGDYSECLRVYAPKESINGSMGGFYGHYCTATWTLNATKTMSLSTGLCIPQTCGKTDFSGLEKALLILTAFSGNNQSASLVKFEDINCKSLKIEWDGPAIAMIFILSVFGIMMTLGTSITVFEHFTSVEDKDEPNSNPNLDSEQQVCNSNNGDELIINKMPNHDAAVASDNLEKYIDKKQLLHNPPTSNVHSKGNLELLKKVLKCFCIITNGAKILNTNVGKDQLRCIHGIRFLSMSWVILGHTYIFGALSVIGNILEVIRLIDNWPFQVIIQATFSVDSFFLLSGFLLTHLFLKEANKRDGKISWIQFYVHRYWRLTPVYMIVLGFNTALTKYVSNGPFWLDDGSDEGCKVTWWWNVLYINNFVDASQACVAWAWYLANDMQFYIISPLFLYSIWRWPKAGLSLLATLMCGSWIATGVITSHYNLLGGYFGITDSNNGEDYMQRMADYFKMIYIKPYTRIGPYLIGVFLGYFISLIKGKEKSVTLVFQTIGWTLAAFLSLSMIYGWYHADSTISTAVFVNVFSRTLFTMALAWVIFACLTGHGGVINAILSHEFFIPLSRLTYCAYLVHPIIIMAYYQSLSAALMFSHVTMVTLFFGFMVLSYGVAFVTSLAFESPLMALEKLVLSR